MLSDNITTTKEPIIKAIPATIKPVLYEDPDERASAKAVGIINLIVVISLITLLFILDINTYRKNLLYCRQNVGCAWRTVKEWIENCKRDQTIKQKKSSFSNFKAWK